MTTIFRNSEKLETSKVVELFKDVVEKELTGNQSEIEELAEIYAKNPVDKFIVSEKLDVEAAQGDILIWAEGTSSYNDYIDSIEDLEDITGSGRRVLQKGDSITGDHRLVFLDDCKFKLCQGVIRPSFLGDVHGLFGQNYECLTLETDKPFLIVHREHGNIALPSGKYMFCSAMDSATLDRMMD